MELPPISRARDCHLYTVGGERILDLYLDDGSALLGHRPVRPILALKDTVSRGLLCEYPSVHDRRIVKALTALRARFSLPGGPLRVFRSRCRALERTAERMPVWRPFAGNPVPAVDDGTVPPPLELAVPFPGSWAPRAVLFPGREESEVPESDTLSPPLAAAFCRAIYDLVGFDPPEVWISEGARVDAAVSRSWGRDGPYLHWLGGEESYDTIFRTYLRAKILINPRYPGPSILPIIWSKGERMQFVAATKLANQEAGR